MPVSPRPLDVQGQTEIGGAGGTTARAVILEIDDVHVSLGGQEILHGVSIEVGAGEVVGLIGPNSAGKSTIINTICGVWKVRQGAVKLAGRDLSRHSVTQRARLGIGRTFQIPRVTENLTVEEEVVLGLRPHRLVDQVWLTRRLTPKLTGALTSVSMLERSRDLGRDLTLSEVRRLEVARAFVAEPKVVLADEPASGMSNRESQALGRLFRQMAADGAGILLVEHNIPFVRAIADRLVVLDLGRVIASGGVDKVLADRRVVEAYLGTE